MRIPITIGWRLAKRYPYQEAGDCPLFHALRRAGIHVHSVGGTVYYTRDGVYQITADWDTDIQKDVARSHRSAKFYHDTKLKALVPR